MSATGALTYTLAPDANGVATIGLHAHDNGGILNSGDDTSAIQTFTITVTGTNDAPTCVTDNNATFVNASLNAAIDSCVDIDADSLNYALVTQSTHGTTAVNANGTYTYTPNANFLGNDSFTFKANDGTLDSNVATMTIQVQADPIARNDVAPTDFPAIMQGSGPTAIPVLANDVDKQGGPLLVQSVTQGAKGKVAITGGGTGVTYDPTGLATGNDSFHYTIVDNQNRTNSAIVVVVITPDTFDPVVTTPTATIVSPSTLGTTTGKVRISWAAQRRRDRAQVDPAPGEARHRRLQDGHADEPQGQERPAHAHLRQGLPLPGPGDRRRRQRERLDDEPAVRDQPEPGELCGDRLQRPMGPGGLDLVLGRQGPLGDGRERQRDDELHRREHRLGQLQEHDPRQRAGLHRRRARQDRQPQEDDHDPPPGRVRDLVADCRTAHDPDRRPGHRRPSPGRPRRARRGPLGSRDWRAVEHPVRNLVATHRLPGFARGCYHPVALSGQVGAYFALFSEIGILLLVTTLVGALAGHWVDEQLGTVAVFVVIGFFGGAAIGTVGIYRLITRFLARFED